MIPTKPAGHEDVPEDVLEVGRKTFLQSPGGSLSRAVDAAINAAVLADRSRRAKAPAEAKPVALTGGELWEWLFGELHGAVPRVLTDELLDSLAAHIRQVFIVHPDPRAKAAEAAMKAVRDAQDVLAEYLPSDSGVSETECVNRLLGILDHQDLVRAMRLDPPRAAEAVPGMASAEIEATVTELLDTNYVANPQMRRHAALVLTGVFADLQHLKTAMLAAAPQPLSTGEAK